jgi:hypothetical protein
MLNRKHRSMPLRRPCQAAFECCRRRYISVPRRPDSSGGSCGGTLTERTVIFHYAKKASSYNRGRMCRSQVPLVTLCRGAVRRRSRRGKIDVPDRRIAWSSCRSRCWSPTAGRVSMPQQARFARGNRPAVVVQCGQVVPRVQAYYGALQPARVFLRLQNTEGKEQP